MHGFTKALALEVAKKGVTVNTISPGYIGTKMVMAIPQEVLDSKIIPQIPMGRLGKPDEVAGLVAYLSSDEAAFVTGANIAINGGQHMYLTRASWRPRRRRVDSPPFPCPTESLPAEFASSACKKETSEPGAGVVHAPRQIERQAIKPEKRETTMRQSIMRPAIIVLGILALLASTIAEAQWVIVARRAIGRVEQMSQSQPNGGVTYDSAVVTLDASADKVYAAVVRGVRAAQGISVTRQDDSTRLIQFTDGAQIAGIKVSALSDDVSNILVSSAHSGSQPDATALVTNSILRVCNEMHVECARAQQ